MLFKVAVILTAGLMGGILDMASLLSSISACPARARLGFGAPKAALDAGPRDESHAARESAADGRSRQFSRPEGRGFVSDSTDRVVG